MPAVVNGPIAQCCDAVDPTALARGTTLAAPLSCAWQTRGPFRHADEKAANPALRLCDRGDEYLRFTQDRQTTTNPNAMSVWPS